MRKIVAIFFSQIVLTLIGSALLLKSQIELIVE
jgi:hypothetical protein